MHRLIQYYRLANVLSLDVAVGAIICTLFFSKIFNIEVGISAILCLGLSVWIIYTADHLLDTYGIQHQASTSRHRFHQQNKNLLSVILLVAFVITIPQLFFIRKPVLLGGIILSAIIALYFLLQKQLRYLKELFGAFLYVGGVLLVPLSLKFEYLSSTHIILIIQFFITALLNLLLFSWFDYQKDSIDHRESFATIVGPSQAKKTLFGLFTINGLLSVFLFLAYGNLIFASVIILVMNLILMVIYLYKNYFSINDRYRIIGDAVFIIPLLYILFAP